MSSKPILGYWDIRGIAEPIRYMLKYAGVDFIDKRYQFGEGKSFAEVESIKKNWNKEKSTLGLDFPNIPYYIDRDIKITQNLAIMRHLGHKYGLFAKDERSLARQDMVEQQLSDLRGQHFIMVIFNSSDLAKSREELTKKQFPEQLGMLSKFLGDHEWFAGNQLTYVDFLAYEIFDWMRVFAPGCLDAFNNLSQLMVKFENIPQIAAYRKSGQYKDWPLLAPFAPWGHFK